MSNGKEKSRRLWLKQLVWFIVFFDVVCIAIFATFLSINLIDVNQYKTIPAITITDLAVSSISLIFSIVIPLFNRRFIDDYFLDKDSTKNIRILIQTIYLNILILSLILLVSGSVFYLTELNFALIGLLVINLLILFLFIFLPGFILIVLKENYVLYLVRFSYLHHYYLSDLNNDSSEYSIMNKKSNRIYFISDKQVDALINQILIKEKFDDNMLNFFCKNKNGKSVKYAKKVIFNRFAKNQINYSKGQYAKDVFDIKKHKIDSDRTSISLLGNLFFICENDDYILNLYNESPSTPLYDICKAICGLFSLADSQPCYSEMYISSYSPISRLLGKIGNENKSINESILALLNSLAIESLSTNNIWFVKALSESFVGNNLINRETQGYYSVFITFYLTAIVITDENSVNSRTKDLIKDIIASYGWRTFSMSGFISSNADYFLNLFVFISSSYDLHMLQWIPIISKTTTEMFNDHDFSSGVLFALWFLFAAFAISQRKCSVHELHDSMTKSAKNDIYSQNINILLNHVTKHPEYYDDVINFFGETKIFSNGEIALLKADFNQIVSEFKSELKFVVHGK